VALLEGIRQDSCNSGYIFDTFAVLFAVYHCVRGKKGINVINLRMLNLKAPHILILLIFCGSRASVCYRPLSSTVALTVV